MFGRKSSVVNVGDLAQVQTTPTTPKPQKVTVEGDHQEIEAYVELCRKINAETPAVRMLQLKLFLKDRGIPEYNRMEVRDHLKKLMQEIQTNDDSSDRCKCFWHPLRTKDEGIDFLWFWYPEPFATSKALYPKLVPSSILQTVATILEKFPDAKFFVSDISNVLDPFLLVTFPGQSPVIVDFWDEPGFRPTK